MPGQDPHRDADPAAQGRPVDGRWAPRGHTFAHGVRACLIGLLLVGAVPPSGAAPPPGWAEAEAVLVFADAQFPTDIDMAPDGSVWFTELAGNVSRYDPDTDDAQVMHHVENVVTGRERGLLGLALAGDFEETGAFYLYYSERTDDPDGGMNRLVRVEDGQEHELASLTAALEHNGGRIVVAPDGTLFVGTGENSLHEPAQDLDSLLGKVLHMTPSGEPAEGNMKGLVYSYGHRNVYGLARDPDTGALWAVENMGWRRDEVNIVEPGGNYGYPECEGHGLHGVDDPCPTDKGYIFPVKTFYEDRAAAPTGAAFWQGGFYWASFNEGSIHHLWQEPDSGEWRDEIVFDHEARVLDLLAAHDGELYFSALDGIWRVSLGGDEAPGPGEEDDDPPTEGTPPTGSVPGPSLALGVLVAAGLAMLARRGKAA